MIKNILLYVVGAAVVFSACKKSDPLTGPLNTSLAYVSFTNVNASAKLVNVLVDGNKISNANYIAANATLAGTYAGVTPGSRAVVLRDTATTSTIDYYTNNITVTGGSSYSFYLYDVVTGGKLKGILLNTDRTPDANPANSKVRFLNFSPGSPALDFWLVRREATVAKDSSILVAGIPYLGNVASPDITALSAFKSATSSLLAGATSSTSPATDYIIRVKVAGTSTIVASTAATTLVNSRNYTFFARGVYPSVTITSMYNN